MAACNGHNVTTNKNIEEPVGNDFPIFIACSDGRFCEIEATVVSGFEPMAKEEIEEKLGVTVRLTSRGRVNMMVPINDVQKVLTLRSVDNLLLVVNRCSDFRFSDSLTETLAQMRAIVPHVDWETALLVWSKFFSFPHVISPVSKPDYQRVLTTSALNIKDNEPVSGTSTHALDRNFELLNIQALHNVDQLLADDIPDKSIIDFAASSSVEPAINLSNMEPAINLSNVEPAINLSNVEPAINLSNVEPAINLSNVEPAINLSNESDSQNKNESFERNVKTPNDVDAGEDAIATATVKTGIKPPKNPLLPSYRATCNRVGTRHCFQSPQAAANFGGEINNYFGWNVDLENFDIEVVLNIDDDDIRVCIALTRESLHKRDIVKFGPTTLRPTIAYGMLRMCKIVDGETVCDPMCGGGSIPVEAAINWPLAHHFCGDIYEFAPGRCMKNVRGVNNKRRKKGLSTVNVDVFRWDASNLPLKENSMDVFVTDMPFGKRIGSRQSNWHLYPRLLTELARVSKVETGRACLLTHDRKCIIKSLMAVSHLWKRGSTVGINIGGLAASVYLLHRTTAAFNGEQKTDTNAETSQQTVLKV